MRKLLIDTTSRIVNSAIGKNVEIREYSTIHDSKIGNNSKIYEHTSIKKSRIGKKVVINSGTYIEFADIEESVFIGPSCSIVGVFHKFSKKGFQKKDNFARVKIKRKVFLGANSVVLPGREIGEGSIIGAGAVITGNIPSFHIVVGIPPNQTIKSLKKWINQKIKDNF